jgi:hypothetical protein
MTFTSVQLRGVQGSSYKRELLCVWSQSGDAAVAEVSSTVLLWNAISVEQLSRGKRRCLHDSSVERQFVWSACRAVKVRAYAEEDVPSERSTLILAPHLPLPERPRIRVCSLRVRKPRYMCIFDVSPLWTSLSPSVRWSSSHWDYDADCP